MSAAALLPIILLCCSNVFMTFAWYGHLKFPQANLLLVIFLSWGIALFEYFLVIPANRWGIQHFSAAELKTIQEVITLTVFVGFSVLFLGEKITLQHIAGFAVMAIGAAIIFMAPK